MKIGFSFTKKAEPKRKVEALCIKEHERRDIITSLDAGKVELESPGASVSALTIPCKNPLAKPKSRPTPRAADAEPIEKGGLIARSGPTPCTAAMEPIEKGGLIARSVAEKGLAKLSAEDAEAMHELLKDAASHAVGEETGVAMPVVPILMREGSKKTREARLAPEATKEMFERVAVENFGEAMLRGMGYDPSVHSTKPVVRDQIRDHRLGLGAKAMTPLEKAAAAKKRSRQEFTSSKPADAKRPCSEGSLPREVCWASRGLVVRVISQSSELRDFFGCEAVVLEVDPASKTCKIKARIRGESRTKAGVGMEDLETRVSSNCREVRIVRGDMKGTVAKLLKRDSERGRAIVQLDAAMELPLDDVCQFMA